MNKLKYLVLFSNLITCFIKFNQRKVILHIVTLKQNNAKLILQEKQANDFTSIRTFFQNYKKNYQKLVVEVC